MNWIGLSKDIKDHQQWGCSDRANKQNLFFKRFSSGLPTVPLNRRPALTPPQTSTHPPPQHTPRLDTFVGCFNLSLKQVPVLGKTSCLVLVSKKAAPSGLNDFRLVALTSHVMKVLEKLVLAHIGPQVKSALDPLQDVWQLCECPWVAQPEPKFEPDWTSMERSENAFAATLHRCAKLVALHSKRLQAVIATSTKYWAKTVNTYINVSLCHYGILCLEFWGKRFNLFGNKAVK